MNPKMIKCVVPIVAFLLAGCAGSKNVNQLVYAKSLTIGINVSAAGGTNPDFTVGVRSQNVAIVPAYDEKSGNTVHGSVGGADPQDKDALSVLGQFEADTTASGVTLGEFFSTGVAAQKLADGFACKVSSGQVTAICTP